MVDSGGIENAGLSLDAIHAHNKTFSSKSSAKQNQSWPAICLITATLLLAEMGEGGGLESRFQLDLITA